MAKSLNHNVELWFDELPDLLFEAVYSYDMTDDPDWSDLDALSSHTCFEGLEVDAYSSIVQDDDLIAPGRIYVKLHYGAKRDGFSFVDSYPVRIFFTISEDENEKKVVIIKKVQVDVSSFYE